MDTLETTDTGPLATVRDRTRGIDRRSGLTNLLASLASSLAQQRNPQTLRSIFEAGVRRLVPVRMDLLADSSAVPPARAASTHRLAFNVPTSDPARPAALACLADSPPRLDEWDLQALTMASYVGALVLEVERARGYRIAFAVQPGDGTASLIGSSTVMQALRDRIERVAATDFTVLIEGESGTGKELVARQVHELSRRRNGPFVAVNCAALVETLLEAELFGIEERTATGVRGRRGKFEHADGGTLFLDEVSDLSVSAQAKLLRVIQDLAVERVGGHGSRRVNSRIVAATNQNLGSLVERRLFRPDLFYRLSGVELQVPPLRCRREDVLELSQYFLERHQHTRRLQLSAAAADALVSYDWPGNVRELERLMERAVALTESSSIGLDDLPPSLRGGYADILLPSLERADTLRAWGSRYVRLVLERSGRNKRRACRALGISYHTLQAYLRYSTRAAGLRGEDAFSLRAGAPGIDPDRQEGRSSEGQPASCSVGEW